MSCRFAHDDGFTRPIIAGFVAAGLIVCSTIASAQTSSPDVGAAAAIGAEGPLHAALHRDAPWFRDEARSDQQTVNAPKSNWLVRHTVITGTLIGTGTGLALSQVDSIGSVNHDPRVGVLGAAIGAWSGLIASASQKARAGQKVGVGTKFGIAAGAVSLIVLPVLAVHAAGG
jgi:hypothetical protein